jgi:hypothetical protein
MKSKTVSGKIANMWGKKLPHVLSYKGETDQYETFAEVKAANDVPNDEEVVKFRNSQRVANRRQKLMADALQAAADKWAASHKVDTDNPNPFIAPTVETDPELRRENIIESLMAAGKSREKAEELADLALNS